MDLHFEDSNKVMKKHTTKWREGKTVSFIRMYKSHPCLWDTSLEEYKNREIREAAYHDLSDRFELTLCEVKNKIKNLRSTYLQELKKQRKSRKYGSNPEDQYEPNLVWFKEMDAMLNGTSEDQSLKSKVGEVPPDSNFEEILPDLQYQSPDISMNVRRPSKKKYQELEEDNHSSFIKMENWQQMEENEHSPFIKMENVSKSTTESTPEDEFDIFGRHVAAQLRQMTIVRALKVQTRFQYILYKERLEELQEPHIVQDLTD